MKSLSLYLNKSSFMRNNVGYILFSFLFLLLSCGTEEVEEQIVLPTKQESSNMNKTWIKEEHEEINQFVKLNGWEVIKTGTGLKYTIYENGNGDLAKPGMIALVDFEVSLLDGTIISTSDSVNHYEFRIAMDYLESGLHEGITYMKEGDRAKIIIPSYLAHGLIGDMDKIPPLATIIYDLKLIQLWKQ